MSGEFRRSVAESAARRIIPDHYKSEDDCWYTCPAHPDSCNDRAEGEGGLGECDCNLTGRRREVADIVEGAISEYELAVVAAWLRSKETAAQ